MSRKLTFNKEGNVWYIDLPSWPGPKHALSMVAGADDLLDYASKGKDTVTVDVTTSSDEIEGEGIRMDRIDASLTGGATYKTNIPSVPTAWLCPVTLFVFQKYPKHFLITVDE